MNKSALLSERITVVIPALNEIKLIKNLIHDIVKQHNSLGLTVIVADGGSTDGTQEEVQQLSDLYADQIKLSLIKGGSVSRGRNAGLACVKTPLVVFIDADVSLPHAGTLLKTADMLHHEWLVSAPLRSRSGWPSSIIYRLYNGVVKIMAHWRPFAVGSYFATRTCLAKKKGGFREDVVHSEDWLLSGMYPTQRFSFIPHPILVDDRRFKKMGYFGMLKVLWGSLTHGEAYMKQDNGYWK